MCPNKSLFMSYEAFDGWVHVIGNDTSYKVVNKGIIKLKMFDGMIKQLKDVRHMPELKKKNLIPLSMLDKMGCSVKFESDTLKVIKGSMVLMRGYMNNGMYVFQGSVVTSDGEVSNQNLDKTILWHLRLGYMSETGLKRCQNRGFLEMIRWRPRNSVKNVSSASLQESKI